MPLPNSDPFLIVPPLPHEQLRVKVTARRRRYLTLGYEPIPIISGRKRPALDDWRKAELDLDTVSAWANDRPGELSTGIRTKYTPGFDIDIHDADMADRVQQVLVHMLHGTILKRTGLPPKRLIPCRCTTPFNKISAIFKSPDNVIHKIEVLADGQQFVAEGIHEDTHQPYRWEDSTDLLSVAHEHLPLVDEALARRFVTEASAEMKRADWIEVDAQGRPKKNNTKQEYKQINDTKQEYKQKPNGSDNAYCHFALKDECAALAAMPPNSGRNDALNRAAFNLFQLVAGGGLDEAEVREQLFAAAEKCGLVADDGEKSVLATIESGAKKGREQPRQAPEQNNDDQADQHDDEDDELIEAADLEMCGVEWLWPGRFALGKIGLIAGLPDMGKGQIAAFIAAAVTNNVDLPCDEGKVTRQGNVIWFNAEDGVRDTIKPRLVAAGADHRRVHFIDGVRISGKEKHFSLVTDLHLLRKAIKRIGNVVLVIIDPISAYLGVGKVDSRQASDVRAVLTPLKNMAEELNITVIGITHFNKKEDMKSALLRVSDSIAYVAAARHVYAVFDDPEDKDSKLFIKAKNNLARDTKALRYGMGVRKVGHDAKLGVDINAPFIVWNPQHVDMTANEAMAAIGGSHTARQEAREFLQERLEAGPVKAIDVIEEAKQNGIAKRTLDRVKKQLNIRSRKRGDGEWCWELPNQGCPQ